MKRNTDTLYILRFFAALVVVLFHYTPANGSQLIGFIIKNGGEAVTFFFFISGFVLTITNASFFANDGVEFDKKTFYVKRFARIYPMYLLALLTLLFFHFAIRRIDTPTVLLRMPFEALGVQKWFYSGSFNYPGWSLSCEFLFYLAFPFLAKWIRSRYRAYERSAWVYYAFAALATYALSIPFDQEMHGIKKLVVNALFLNPLLLISIFALGVLAGRQYLDDKPFYRNQLRNFTLCVVCVALIAVVKWHLENISPWLRGGLLAPVYFVMIPAVTSFRKDRTAIFSSRPFIFLGEISYSMYIMQYPVYVFFKEYIAEVKSLPVLGGYVLVLIIVSSVTYYIVEAPLRKLIVSRYAKKPVRVHEQAIL